LREQRRKAPQHDADANGLDGQDAGRRQERNWRSLSVGAGTEHDVSADPTDMAMEQSAARRKRFYGDSDGDED
jgi:hypothetical protein